MPFGTTFGKRNHDRCIKIKQAGRERRKRREPAAPARPQGLTQKLVSLRTVGGKRGRGFATMVKIVNTGLTRNYREINVSQDVHSAAGRWSRSQEQMTTPDVAPLNHATCIKQ